MNDVRDLLIECRMELRRKIPDFLDSRLSRRLTDAILSLGDSKASGGQRPVALTQEAWQLAIRELKDRHPAVYDQVMLRVLALLRAGGVREAEMDAVAAEAAAMQEVKALRDEVAALRAQLRERAA